MENFQFFCLLTEDDRNENDDWRLRYVFHRTSTGQRNKVRVKSLPKDDQWKYAPIEVKLKRQAKLKADGIDSSTPSSDPELLRKPSRVFTVYYSADRVGGFDKFETGKLVMVTDDSSKAMDIEKKGLKVAVAHMVPIDAFEKYWDYDKKEWVGFSKDIEVEKKFELIKFTDNDVYLVDFFKYKDQINFQMSSLDDTEGDSN